MRTPFDMAVNMASLLQRKQTQISRDVGIGRVAEYLATATGIVFAAGAEGPISIADGFLGRGWKSVAQQLNNALIGLARTVRLQSGVFQNEVLTQIAKFTQLYDPAPAGFAVWLADLGTMVEDDIFPLLAADYTAAATAAWDEASSRVVS